jgi:hypothetical protein
MPTWGWIVIAVVVVLAVVAALAAAAARRRKSERIKGRFGPEYERTVEEAGSRRKAESELSARERRREELDIRPLQPAARDRYVQAWRDVQVRFVDMPSESLREADALVTQVMGDCGYPMEDFEQRAADVSVDHPRVVEDYRTAHAISQANDGGRATTEDLRRAMVHYRTLFENLLDAGQGTASRAEGVG